MSPIVVFAALDSGGNPVLMQFLIAGAATAGGLTWFVNCWKSDKYQRQLRKRLFCDTFGGLNVGYFVSLFLFESPDHYRASIAFILGLSWGVAAQFITEKITGTVLESLRVGLGGGIRGAIEAMNQAINQPTATATTTVAAADVSPKGTGGANP